MLLTVWQWLILLAIMCIKLLLNNIRRSQQTQNVQLSCIITRLGKIQGKPQVLTKRVNGHKCFFQRAKSETRLPFSRLIASFLELWSQGMPKKKSLMMSLARAVSSIFCSVLAAFYYLKISLKKFTHFGDFNLKDIHGLEVLQYTELYGKYKSENFNISFVNISIKKRRKINIKISIA